VEVAGGGHVLKNAHNLKVAHSIQGQRAPHRLTGTEIFAGAGSADQQPVGLRQRPTPIPLQQRYSEYVEQRRIGEHESGLLKYHRTGANHTGVEVPDPDGRLNLGELLAEHRRGRRLQGTHPGIHPPVPDLPGRPIDALGLEVMRVVVQLVPHPQ